MKKKPARTLRPVCRPGLQTPLVGRYEARIRETSKKGEMSQRPRSVGEMSNRSAEYDKFQAELRKHPRNTDEQSTSSWKDKELYLEEHISTKLQAKERTV